MFRIKRENQKLQPANRIAKILIMKLSPETIKQRQSLPLEAKILLSKRRIKEWYDYWSGNISVSFSGGKDSTALLFLVRSMYRNVVAVFVDTGLEFPEIKEFIKTIDNVVWLKPKMPFTRIIKEYGYPIISKRQARFISDAQNSNPKNQATVNLRLTGYNQKGEYCPSMMISKKWLPLIGSGFKISSKCCDIMKKNPLVEYQRQTGSAPLVGSMASESNARLRDYQRNGCNLYDAKSPMSMPLSFWNDSNIWKYLKENNIKYSRIYDMGYRRTGCIFCGFGAHLEKSDMFDKNRYQRLKETHPKLHRYCMENLGFKKVLQFAGIAYK